RLSGRTVVSVTQRRRAKHLGMFGFNPHFWTKAEERLLGRHSDTEVARRVGLTTPAVAARRAKLGIPRPRGHGPWNAEDDALLGTMPDQDLARKLSRTLGGVIARRQAKRILPYGSQRRKSRR